MTKATQETRDEEQRSYALACDSAETDRFVTLKEALRDALARTREAMKKRAEDGEPPPAKAPHTDADTASRGRNRPLWEEMRGK